MGGITGFEFLNRGPGARLEHFLNVLDFAPDVHREGKTLV